MRTLFLPVLPRANPYIHQTTGNRIVSYSPVKVEEAMGNLAVILLGLKTFFRVISEGI